MSDIGDYDEDESDVEETEEERDARSLRTERFRLDVERTTALGYTGADIRGILTVVMLMMWVLPWQVSTALVLALAVVALLWTWRAGRLAWAYVEEVTRPR